jgi:hypothetical protein
VEVPPSAPGVAVTLDLPHAASDTSNMEAHAHEGERGKFRMERLLFRSIQSIK